MTECEEKETRKIFAYGLRLFGAELEVRAYA